MPLYPYDCKNCGKRFSTILSYEEYEQAAVHCPHCESENVARRLGRVRFARSEESRLESIADPAKLAGMEDDPKAMAKMMRQMSSEFGEEAGEDLGDDFEQVVDRLEAGQTPDQIEKDLPDLGGDDL
jgi:putative FmdB family regulatory protein